MAESDDQDKQKQPLTIAAPFPANQSPSAIAPLSMAPPNAIAANMGAPNAVSVARPQPVAMAAPGATPASPTPIQGGIAPPTSPGTPVGANIHAGMIAPPTPAQSGVQRLWGATGKIAPFSQDSTAGKVGNTALKTIARIGTGALTAGDVAAESLDPRAASLIPGSEINTNLKNAANEQRYEKQTAESIDQQKADAGTARAKSAQEQADTDKAKQQNPPPKEDKTPQLPAEESQWLKDNPGKTVMDYRTALTKADEAGKPPAKTVDPKAELTNRLAAIGLRPIFAADGTVSSMQAIPGFKEPDKGTFGGAYAAVRSLEESAREFPSMFKPLLEKMNAAQGLGLSPADIDAATQNFMAGLATSGGQPLGTASRLNPTSQTESQAQMADKVLNELPRINKEIDSVAENIGPVQGRLMVGFLLGSVGSTGNKQLDNTLTQLRTDVTLLESAGSKFHVGTQKAIDDLAQDVNAGKSSADALHGFTSSIENWAKQAQKEGKEVSGRTLDEEGHSFTYNGKQYQGVPDNLYNKYKGKPGFTEGSSAKEVP